jgi:hypothetical protein
MRGFSFVEDIGRAQRQEKRLEEELERQRRRQDLADERATTLFTQSQEDRTRALDMQNRMLEATRLLSDPNVDATLLEPYSDIPQVAAVLSGRITDAEAGISASSRRARISVAE